MRESPPEEPPTTIRFMQTHEFAAMLDHDDAHWWYRGRRRVLRAQLDRLVLPADPLILDAGCGSGRTLDELCAYGTVAGADLSEEAVAAARARGHHAVVLAPVEALPFADGAFDLVTCLDVIEHTADDGAALAELLRVTDSGGYVIVTVPAHQALWSNHDVVNQHYRRYSRDALRAAARAAGFEVVEETGFNLAPLAPAAIVRAIQNRRPTPPSASDLELTPRWADRYLEVPIAAEAWWMRRGGRVPTGLSRLAVLRRPSVSASVAARRPANDVIRRQALSAVG